MKNLIAHEAVIAVLVIFALHTASIAGTLLSDKIYKTISGKTVTISERHPKGWSLSTIIIRSKGFQHNISKRYEDMDPISNVIVADLDGNQFDEIYIITTSTGSGSYGNVMGFASNGDKELKRILFPPTSVRDPVFKGYQGHDLFAVEDRKFIRTFPVYPTENSEKNIPSGKRKLVYGLYKGGRAWQLKLETSETIEQFVGGIQNGTGEDAVP